VKLLSEKTWWFANEQFTIGLPSAGATALVIKPDMLKNIVYIEGERENVIPKDNFERVAAAFPNVPRAVIPRTGHFPMLENSQDFLNKVTSQLDQCSEFLESNTVVNN
jgi:pimeloyl-ACP methyl ester carboxylesterase